MPELAVNSEPLAGQEHYSAWFASATAALIASLEAVEAKGKWVAVPPNVCPNVIAAIYGAECKPWFVDIEPERQGIDPQKLGEIIADVAAVLVVHAYGVPCKIDQIAEIANKAGIPLIEDCAQSDGATYSGQEVGSFGDIAVFSFGKGKIVDAGGGGLAIVRNHHWQARFKNVIASWQPSNDGLAGDDLGNVYRFFYNRFYPDRTAFIQESFLAVVKELAPLFKTMCNPKRVAVLLDQRSHREFLVAARRRKYRDYVNYFAGAKYISSIPMQEGAAPWRFNALVDVGKRDALFQALLNSGAKASTWYPRMTEFLPRHAFRSTDLPVSLHFEQRILNLWVDDETNSEVIEHTCEKIKQELQLHTS